MADWIYVRNDVFQIYKESGMKKNDIIDNGIVNVHYFLNGDRAREFNAQAWKKNITHKFAF